MRIRVFGFSSDSNRPPSRYGLISAILSCLLVGAVMVQQILKGRWDNLSILFLAVAFAASVYHLIYQARGLYRQKKKQSEDAEFMHKAEEPDYELPQKGENLYYPYCGRAVETDYEFCNTCGKKLP